MKNESSLNETIVRKKAIVEKICKQLSVDLQNAQFAAQATRDAATNEESKPENQYDTRALEASYLAGAQAHRVREIEAQLIILKQTAIHAFSPESPIGPSALVTVECDGQQSLFFVLPQAGGMIVSEGGKNIQVVTPSSPLGAAIVGLKIGDLALAENPKRSREYEIISVE